MQPAVYMGVCIDAEKGANEGFLGWQGRFRVIRAKPG